MSRRRTSYAVEDRSAGYSLVEVVVATSLVVTVLIPLAGAGVYLLTVRQNRPYLQALAIGQQTMEETLQARSYASEEFEMEGRWEVRKTVNRVGERVTIAVRVFRKDRSEPLVVLITVRLRQGSASRSPAMIGVHAAAIRWSSSWWRCSSRCCSGPSSYPSISA